MMTDQEQSVDNLELVLPMLDVTDDGDTFWYTEILDRERCSAGSNRKRLVRMFRHHCRDDLIETMPVIRAICDAMNCRAYIRLSPRSQKAAGQKLLILTATMAAEESWSCAAHLFARACGQTNIHDRKLWLYDIDGQQDMDGSLLAHLTENGWLRGMIPSRSGKHYIAIPHDPRNEPLNGVALHKDNPTNLYIPAAISASREADRKEIERLRQLLGDGINFLGPFENDFYLEWKRDDKTFSLMLYANGNVDYTKFDGDKCTESSEWIHPEVARLRAELAQAALTTPKEA